VFNTVLTGSQVANLNALGRAPAPNQAPVARFTSTTTDLQVDFDASTSTDTDGTIHSYAWDFGDGTNATGQSTSHTYNTEGVHTVTLLVTDNDGASNQVSHDVTVTRPANQLPTAAFTSSANKLKLSVDGSGSTDSDGTITGYAWTFGDGGTASTAAATHTYALAGTYTVALTVTDDRGGVNTVQHDVTVSSNVGPTALFTTVKNKLHVSVDATTSTDSDGTITGFAWDYGDGSFGTGVTDTHTYAEAGTYPITLTVTDNDGGTGSKVTSVAVVANAKPTAAFTSTVADLKASVDASATADSDGTVTGYAWDFGDGATGSGQTTSHTYALAGTYSVVLTVTDNDGATDAITHSVTVTAPPVGVLAKDQFGRTLATGWGTADTGGAYSLTGAASLFGVSGGTGSIRVAAGSTPKVFLNGVSSTDTDLTADVSMDKVANAGSASVYLVARGTATDGYRGRVAIGTNGALTLTVSKAVANTETVVKTGTVPGLTYTAGTVLHLRMQAVGSGSTDLKLKVWKDGTAEPSTWQVTATDTTASLQSAKGVGIMGFLSTSATNSPVTLTIDNLLAQPTGATPPPVNAKPVAAFSSSAADLTASVNASGSTDSDGTITGYAWDFGDGQVGTGQITNHTYGASGTFQVKLTVTDDGGATDTVTHPVTVTAPPAGVLAQDEFSRNLATGWGTADTGGAWTLSGAANLFGVNGGVGTLSVAAGKAPAANLNSVASTSTEVTADVSIDKLPNTGSVYIDLVGRGDNTNAYRGRVLIGSTGAVQVHFTKTVAGVESSITSSAVSGLTYTAGTVLHVKLQVDGSGTTLLKLRVWKDGTTEPTTWQLQGTDATAALQSARGIGIRGYLSGSVANGPVTISVDHLKATPVV
jgi:large repetitive protein